MRSVIYNKICIAYSIIYYNNLYNKKYILYMISYLFLGVQKGGSSTFKNYMNLHPDVYCQGETHYFDFACLF